MASQLNAATDTTGPKDITYVACWLEMDLFGKNRGALEAAKYGFDAAIERRLGGVCSKKGKIPKTINGGVGGIT